MLFGYLLFIYLFWERANPRPIGHLGHNPETYGERLTNVGEISDFFYYLEKHI